MTPPSLRADSLQGIKHGFFGRQGGTSGGIFDSLNCALSSSDSLQAVTANRAAVAGAMGVLPEHFLTLRQVHGTEVFTLRSPEDAARARQFPADAFASRARGVAIGILTADCVPILFADSEAGVIGAAHAGWKGASGGVALRTLEAMESLGARRFAIRAVIGPSIAQPSYEVDAAFRQRFLNLDAGFGRFFTSPVASGHSQFDLKGFVADQLRGAGVRFVEVLPHDTYAEPNRFFSFRRTTHRKERDYGRQVSVIAL